MKTKATKAPTMKSKASTGATRKTKVTATTDTATTDTATTDTVATAITTVSPVSEKMSKLETAYMAAISGEMKFGEVKSIFKQLHKEIKKSVKSKK
jgi:hypothetical protein